MIQLQDKLITNDWIRADWNTYISHIESPEHKKHRGYYYNGYMKIEDMPTGADHSRYQLLTISAISLFCIAKGIAISGLDNCRYHKIGVTECQPDLSYYTANRAGLAPAGTSVVNLDEKSPPDLVIEISNATPSDDLGSKRLLYEELSISEYWVVDAQNNEIIAFEIFNRGSRRIDISLILPGLSIPIVTAALARCREVDDTQIGQWLVSEFQT